MRMMRVFAVLVAVAAVTLAGVSAGAQEKHKISYKTLAANTKYTQQHVIDVGDVPGHQVRIYEIHRTYPTGAPEYEGVKVVEEWIRGFSDYVDINGRHSAYSVFLLENADKIFAQNDGASQTTVYPDAMRRSTATGVTRLNGGTGKFRGIRGILRYTDTFDPKAGINEGQREGEYWIE